MRAVGACVGLLSPSSVPCRRPDLSTPAAVAASCADVAGFDPAVFSVSASECALLDPQQRLLLEAAWEAASRPGASGTSLRARVQARRGARPGAGAGAAAAPEVGVFVGASYAEWALLQQQQGLPPSTYTASGSGLSVLAGGRGALWGREVQVAWRWSPQLTDDHNQPSTRCHHLPTPPPQGASATCLAGAGPPPSPTPPAPPAWWRWRARTRRCAWAPAAPRWRAAST